MSDNDPGKMDAYLDQERARYADLRAARPELSDILEARLEPWLARTLGEWQRVNRFGHTIPDGFLAPYDIDKAEFFATLTDADLAPDAGPLNAKFLQIKYQLRAYNVLREYLRLRVLMPELTETGKPLEVLELSSGGCGNLEVARHFGHQLQSTDFLAGRGSEFMPIHDALDAKAKFFDGSQLPYEFDDNSYDIVICNQAIDAYGRPRAYGRMINEMKRIARSKVQVIFNPYRPGWRRANRDTWIPKIREMVQANMPDADLQRDPTTALPAAIFTL